MSGNHTEAMARNLQILTEQLREAHAEKDGLLQLVASLKETIKDLSEVVRSLKANPPSKDGPKKGDKHPRQEKEDKHPSQEKEEEPPAKRTKPNKLLEFPSPPTPDRKETAPLDSAMEIDSSTVKKVTKPPPPIIVRQREFWKDFKSTLAKDDINIRHARNTSEGIKVHLETVDDFRTVTDSLKNQGKEYTTHQLPQDRELVVVIRGVCQTFSEKEVLEEIQQSVPEAERVHRMKKGDSIWPLVTVHLKNNSAAKAIFDVSSIGGLRVQVEPKRKSKIVSQCRRCMKFRHTANYCQAAWVCAFCSQGHITATCPSKDKKDASPKCANCSGNHRATYRGCPKAPAKEKAQNKEHEARNKPSPRPARQPSHLKPGVSYAAKLNPTSNQGPSYPPQPPLSPPEGQLQEIFLACFTAAFNQVFMKPNDGQKTARK